MTVKYNVTGAKRKELVELIANFTGCNAVYKGAPSFAYEVDYFTIDKNGTLSFDDRADSEVIERLLEMLYDNSFEAESLPEADEPETETVSGAILIPKATLSEEAFENLGKLISNKEELIKKALGIDEASVTEKDGNICFAWIAEGTNPDEVTAITQFVTALCDMAKKQKRINTTEADVENEKYAFRCFLLRLGFIGSEYKATRKVLLKRLEGSSAFRTQKEEVAE